MTLEHSDPWLDIHLGDVRDVLPTLPADSVDCIVTSPPYWGLRDYGTAAWSGGDAACDHKELVYKQSLAKLADKWAPNATPRNPNRADDGQIAAQYRHTCGKCGAIRQDSQLGLERTPEEYVANLVAVFRELRRVLKPSGTCWLNLGDSYASSGEKRNNNGAGSSGLNSNRAADVPMKDIALRLDHGLKPKDLVGIPWRVAFALQADGWYLRSDIIWAKPNPMPESVTDRPTKAHEYLFLLTKSARYYFDADAVREQMDPKNMAHHDRYSSHASNGKYADPTKVRADKFTPNQGGVGYNPAGRNLRSVWTIATRPYPGAHFAVFPPELPERCIKAGSSERGVCPHTGEPWERVVEVEPMVFKHSERERIKHDAGLVTALHGTLIKPAERTTVGWQPTCGAPWERVVERTSTQPGVTGGASWAGVEAHAQISKGLTRPGGFGGGSAQTTGWRPTCDHDAAPVPAVVLDPFAGSGTTGMVANRLSRRAILIDLNGDYLKQQLKRNAQTPLGLA